jgi:hypothetical protein
MNLLTTELNELRRMLQNYNAGTLDANQLNTALGVYNQTEKRMRIYLQALVMGQKLGVPDLDASLIEQMVGGDNNKLDTKKELENRTVKRGRK